MGHANASMPCTNGFTQLKWLGQMTWMDIIEYKKITCIGEVCVMIISL